VIKSTQKREKQFFTAAALMVHFDIDDIQQIAYKIQNYTPELSS
jgi:hypothetical protein